MSTKQESKTTVSHLPEHGPIDENGREILLQVKNVDITFGKGDDAVKAVKNASFDIYKGETFSLVGESGSGKTTTLARTIEALSPELKLAVMEADIDSDVDAATISTSGAKVIQLHTGGMCHLDAGMTRQGLEGLGTENIDLAILENVGNLVCPAEFDTGAVKNAMILSVPEGDDKPLKYPLMFSICDVLLVNKIDVAPYFNFDLDKCIERVKKLNPNIQVFPISALKGEGIEPWADWLRAQTKAWNA